MSFNSLSLLEKTKRITGAIITFPFVFPFMLIWDLYLNYPCNDASSDCGSVYRFNKRLNELNNSKNKFISINDAERHNIISYYDKNHTYYKKYTYDDYKQTVEFVDKITNKPEIANLMLDNITKNYVYVFNDTPIFEGESIEQFNIKKKSETYKKRVNQLTNIEVNNYCQ